MPVADGSRAVRYGWRRAPCECDEGEVRRGKIPFLCLPSPN